MERLQIPEKEALEKCIECLKKVKMYAHDYCDYNMSKEIYDEVENCMRYLFLD